MVSKGQNNMQLELSILIEEVRKINEDLIPLVNKILEKSSEQKLEAKVDSAYVVDKAAESLKFVKSTLEKVSDIIQNHVVMDMLTAMEFSVSTELCTATAKRKVWYKIPSTRRSNPVEFDNLMESI